jgi:putative membrane protein
MSYKRIESIILIAVIALAIGCKKHDEPASDTATTVATVTAVDTTPTGGTVATGTIALTEPDRQFVVDAANAILGEMTFAKSADLLSPDTDVKALGHLLVQDYGNMLAELTRFGQKHGVELPTSVEVAVATDDETLRKLKGKEFDRVYLKHVVDDNTAMFTMFDAEAKVVSDIDLKAWVSRWRARLQDRLDKAKELQAKIGK